MYVIGADPGKTGSIVLVEFDISESRVKDTIVFGKEYSLDDVEPLSLALKEMIKGKNIEAVYVEDVHSMPLQGVASTFEFGRQYGMLLSFLRMSGFDVQLISPQQWQRPFKHVAPPSLSTKKRTKKAFEFWDCGDEKQIETVMDSYFIGLGGWLRDSGCYFKRGSTSTLPFPKVRR